MIPIADHVNAGVRYTWSALQSADDITQATFVLPTQSYDASPFVGWKALLYMGASWPLYLVAAWCVAARHVRGTFLRAIAISLTCMFALPRPTFSSARTTLRACLSVCLPLRLPLIPCCGAFRYLSQCMRWPKCDCGKTGSVGGNDLGGAPRPFWFVCNPRFWCPVSSSMLSYAYLPILTHLVCHHMLTYQSSI